MPWNTFQTTPNNFRINTELFRFLLNFSPVIPIVLKLSSICHRALKCVTLWFVNTPDMTETTLRSMIISGTWISIMTPVRSENKSIEPYTLYSIPFVSSILDLSEI